MVFADMFPPELQDASATLDLASRMHAQYGWHFKAITEMRQLTASSRTALFILCDTDVGSRVAILDPKSLEVLSLPAIAGTISPLGVDGYLTGRFWAGTTSFDSLFNPSSPLNLVTNYSIIIAGSANLTWEYKQGSGIMYCNSVDAAWTTWSGEIAATISSSSSAWELLDAVTVGSGPACRILLWNRDSRTAIIQEYADPSVLATSMSGHVGDFLSDVTSYLSRTTLSGADRDIWLLDDCVVAINHDRDTRLVKYAYGSGDKLDSRIFDQSWKDHVHFEPSGKYWYYYDERMGRLRAYRTWW
jgi:hypothetical protein